ncbi:MAG: hypothetical protein ACRCUY_13180 [Thermoguttaceae bacterium]
MKRIDTILNFLENRAGLSATRNPLHITVMLLCMTLLTTTLVFCQENTTDKKTFFVDMLGTDGLKSYRIDKTVAEFPEKIDLSTPEAAYVTQKQLIASGRKDKIEQLEKVHYTKIKISDRERKGIESISEEAGNEYKKNFVVLEVIPFGKDRAFVYGLQDGKMYDGNYFQKKEDGLWYNQGNDQAYELERLAAQLKEVIARETAKDCTSILKFISENPLAKLPIHATRVDKRIIDFPDKFDMSSPEATYATQKHLLVSNASDKIEQLEKLQWGGGKIPAGRERSELSNPVDEKSAKTYKKEFIVYEVVQFGDDIAFVFALRKFDNLYDGNLFRKKEDGKWYNLGNFQDFDPAELAAEVIKRVAEYIEPVRIEPVH